MALTNDDYTQLEIALLDAFPEVDLLKQMLRHQLDVNLEADAGGNNLQTMIYNLIHNWAKPQGKVSALVTGALKENPGNTKLQLYSLFLYLDQADFTREEMRRFYYRAMPDHALAKPLPANVDARELIFRLDKMPLQSPKNTLPVFTFALLASKGDKGRVIEKQIREWVQLVTIARQLPCDPKVEYQEVIDNQPCDFLSILVLPEDVTQNTFRIKILSDLKQQTVVEISEKSYTELSELAISVLDALNILADTGFDTQKTTIEFFLPFHLLSEAVDQYRLPVFDKPLKLGFLHRVTVRSLDRSQNPHLLRFSRVKWDRMAECREMPLRQRFTRITPFTNLPPPAQLSYDLLRSECICLGLTLIPSAPQQRIDLITDIIAGGIPIALWIRPIQVVDNPLEHERRIMALLLDHDLNQLPERIHQERCKATLEEDEYDCGNHYTLLWDDPYRLPRLSSLRVG